MYLCCFHLNQLYCNSGQDSRTPLEVVKVYISDALTLSLGQKSVWMKYLIMQQLNWPNWQSKQELTSNRYAFFYKNGFIRTLLNFGLIANNLMTIWASDFRNGYKKILLFDPFQVLQREKVRLTAKGQNYLKF